MTATKEQPNQRPNQPPQDEVGSGLFFTPDLQVCCTLSVCLARSAGSARRDRWLRCEFTVQTRLLQVGDACVHGEKKRAVRGARCEPGGCGLRVGVRERTAGRIVIQPLPPVSCPRHLGREQSLKITL